MPKDDVLREKVKKAVQVYAVIDDEGTAFLNVHTHGLTAFNQTELQVIANSLFLRAAYDLLMRIAFNVIIKGERFQAGENCQYEGYGVFTLEQKKDSTGDPVLRIVPHPMKCELCEKGLPHSH